MGSPTNTFSGAYLRSRKVVYPLAFPSSFCEPSNLPKAFAISSLKLVIMSANHAESYLYLKTLYQKSPWSIFEKVWTPLVGYAPDKFEVLEGTTPITTLKETVVLIATYYFVIFAGREFMRDRPAFKLNDSFLVHNFCLTVISGALLALFLEQLVPTVWNHGVFHSICGAGGWTPKLTTLYYVSYLAHFEFTTDNGSSTI